MQITFCCRLCSATVSQRFWYVLLPCRVFAGCFDNKEFAWAKNWVSVCSGQYHNRQCCCHMMTGLLSDKWQFVNVLATIEDDDVYVVSSHHPYISLPLKHVSPRIVFDTTLLCCVSDQHSFWVSSSCRPDCDHWRWHCVTHCVQQQKSSCWAPEKRLGSRSLNHIVKNRTS